MTASVFTCEQRLDSVVKEEEGEIYSPTTVSVTVRYCVRPRRKSVESVEKREGKKEEHTFTEQKQKESSFNWIACRECHSVTHPSYTCNGRRHHFSWIPGQDWLACL